MMKNSRKCPKCNSSEVVRISGRYGHGTGANVILAGLFRRAALVTRYLCVSCGYSEEWVDETKDLDKLRDEYTDYP